MERKPISRRIVEAQALFFNWRKAQEQAHEQGHKPDPLPAYPENPFKAQYLPDGEGTEIELFVDPLTKVRREIDSLKVPAERPTYQVRELGVPPQMASPNYEKKEDGAT